MQINHLLENSFDETVLRAARSEVLEEICMYL